MVVHRKDLIYLTIGFGVILVLNASLYSHYCGLEFPSEALSSPKTYSSKFYLMSIAIMSGPLNRRRRDAIRATWAATARLHNLTALFVVGSAELADTDQKTLKAEADFHKDMWIMADFVDTYENLTAKLIRTMAFLYSERASAFFMKVDDDTFVNINRLIFEMASKPRERLYWGYFSNNARVKASGPWAEHRYTLCERYIPYARGGGYVITRDLLEYVVRNEALLTRFRSEDVSLGTWLGPLDIVREHDVRFDTEAASRGCQNDFLLTHKQTAADIEAKGSRLARNQSLCAEEMRWKAGYLYDWSVPPSQCCQVLA